jgi:hypothetical protein
VIRLPDEPKLTTEVCVGVLPLCTYHSPEFWIVTVKPARCRSTPITSPTLYLVKGRAVLHRYQQPTAQYLWSQDADCDVLFGLSGGEHSGRSNHPRVSRCPPSTVDAFRATQSFNDQARKGGCRWWGAASIPCPTVGKRRGTQGPPISCSPSQESANPGK